MVPDHGRSRSSRHSSALISLSVRLFANMLAGHMLILVFDRPDLHPRRDHLLHRRPDRRSRSGSPSTSSRSSSSSRSRRSSSLLCPPSTSARRSSRSTKEETEVLHLLVATTGDVIKAGKAIGLALGIGPRLARRRHRHRHRLRLDDPVRRPPARAARRAAGDQWLGFALTEAVVFYGLRRRLPRLRARVK